MLRGSSGDRDATLYEPDGTVAVRSPAPARIDDLEAKSVAAENRSSNDWLGNLCSNVCATIGCDTSALLEAGWIERPRVVAAGGISGSALVAILVSGSTQPWRRRPRRKIGAEDNAIPRRHEPLARACRRARALPIFGIVGPGESIPTQFQTGSAADALLQNTTSVVWNSPASPFEQQSTGLCRHYEALRRTIRVITYSFALMRYAERPVTASTCGPFTTIIVFT